MESPVWTLGCFQLICSSNGQCTICKTGLFRGVYSEKIDRKQESLHLMLHRFLAFSSQSEQVNGYSTNSSWVSTLRAGCRIALAINTYKATRVYNQELALLQHLFDLFTVRRNRSFQFLQIMHKKNIRSTYTS